MIPLDRARANDTDTAVKDLHCALSSTFRWLRDGAVYCGPEQNISRKSERFQLQDQQKIIILQVKFSIIDMNARTRGGQGVCEGGVGGGGVDGEL